MPSHTHDYLLDKKVTIFQPLDGYRASTDAVLLASFVKTHNKNAKILDVGSGTGAISLCLAHRLQNVEIKGLELQNELAELSNQSAKANGFEGFLEFINADIKKSPLKSGFDIVVTNPPYSNSDMPSPNPSKATAHNHNEQTLGDWIAFCIRMLKPLGYFYMINRAEALEEILYHSHNKLGAIQVIPIFSKEGEKAKRVVVIGKKTSKTPLEILPSLIVHDKNGEYTPKAHQILRLSEGYF